MLLPAAAFAAAIVVPGMTFSAAPVTALVLAAVSFASVSARTALLRIAAVAASVSFSSAYPSFESCRPDEKACEEIGALEMQKI